MGKTLETKKKILNLLQRKEMTISELSRELGLSSATVSQHMDELRSMGAIEKIDNEHFKKLKYYKRSEAMNMNIAKYVIGVLVIVGALSALYLYAGHGATSPRATAAVPNATGPSVPYNNTNTTTNTVEPAVGGTSGALACPMITYQLSGTVTSSIGFDVYYLNSSNGKIPDYLMGNESSGTIYATERVSGVLNSNTPLTINRTHYASLVPVGSGFNTIANGISASVSPSTYNAVNNTEMNLTIILITNQTAVKGTYWLRIDGPCSGGVTPVLVTVGNKPYNGSVTQSVTPGIIN